MWKVWICPRFEGLNIHSRRWKYSFCHSFRGQYFTKNYTFPLFGNISSVILIACIIGFYVRMRGAGASRAEGAEMETFEHNSLPGSLELAYMGDAIYDLYVRRRLVRRGGRVQNMHREAVKQVCCHAQAQALGRIEGELSEIEAGVVRRARNAHQNPPKNASPAEYHRATALEALIGYLYLTGQQARMDELLEKALSEEVSHEK